jgi:hypothetical protein
VTGLVERIDSAHSIWLFDTERRRFRRLPPDADVDAPALDSDWEPYTSLEIDEATGGFTVTLNDDGTRLLRAYRLAAPEQPTQEIRIEPPADEGS